MQTPEVAIVILNWNGKEFLKKFLPFVMASTYENKRVIVADNASTDDSLSFLKREFPQVGIIVNSQNEGFAKGYNTALRQVESDYYVLLNSDVEVTSSWIEPIISLMESDEKIAACQPKMLSYYKRNEFEYAGACGGWIDSFGYPFARGRIFDQIEKDQSQYENTSPCFWASGAALFVRSSVFHEMNGFDEYFFAHQEEIDLCWRMQLFGYKVYVEPKSVVYHVGGGTLPKGNSRKVFLNFRNNLIMMAKNMRIANAVWKLPLKYVLDALAAWKMLLAGDGEYFMAVIKAHFHFIYWLFFVKRTTPKPEAPSCSFGGWFHGSIVFQHFIKKRKTFKEIVGDK